jgi:hypothetical protein
VLYDADGNVIDTTLESSHDYSGSYLDNTSTDKDYVVMFRAADFCLSKTVILYPTSYILISPDLQYEVGSLTDAVNNTKITWRMKVDGVDIGISASEDTTFLEDFANVLINYGLVVEFGDAGLYIYTNADITRNIELIPDMEYVVKINLYGNPTAKILDDGTIQCKLSGYLSPENVRTGNINGISFDGATNTVQLMNDSEYMLYNSISAIIIDGITYAKQGSGDFENFPHSMISFTADRIKGIYYINFKNLDTKDHLIQLVGYTGDINDSSLKNENTTLSRDEDNGNVVFALKGYSLMGITCADATNQVLMMVDAGLNVPELYIELTVNEQVFRIDMVEDEVFHDTVYNYIEQNLSQYFTVRPYEAHSPAIGYDPAYFFVLENISNQPLRVQVKALSSAATLDGSEYANVSLVSNSDDGYNPTVESVEMPSTTVQFGSTYTACMNPLSVVKINSTLDNTLKVDLTTGMLTISGIKQIQFVNGDLFNVGNVYVNVAEKHTGVAICIIDPDYGENDTVSFGGQALVQVITYPTRSLASINHIGGKYIEMGKVVKSYPTDHLVHVPTQCPNVKTLNSMFSTCSIFNDPNISNWDVSNITGLNSTFSEAYAFNQPLNWNVSKVYDFIGTFASSGFNNDSIKSWDMSNGYMFNGMFVSNRVFNQDISGWNMKNAHNLTEMFFGARAFNQDLSQWCMTNVTALPDNFNGDLCPLTVQHYPVWGTCPRGESNV